MGVRKRVMYTNFTRKSVILFINKVNGGRSSKQCLSAALAPCLLFGLIFLLYKKEGLTFYCGIPFGATVLMNIFYLTGLNQKEESLKKRLFNQLLFCLIFGLGSLYLCILFLCSTKELKNIFLFTVILVYLVVVLVFFGISIFKLVRGKYKNKPSKGITPYIYVAAAILGLSLSGVLQNKNNSTVVFPYVMALVLFVISLANIPYYTNLLRIHLAEKMNITLNDVNGENLPDNESPVLENKRRLINTFFVSAVFFCSVIFETIALDSVFRSPEKKGFVIFAFCVAFVLNVPLNLFNAFFKMNNAKNSIVAVLFTYLNSIVYCIVTMFVLTQTQIPKPFEPATMRLVFFYTLVIHAVISLLISIIVVRFKKTKQK